METQGLGAGLFMAEAPTAWTVLIYPVGPNCET
jgi:hypothetical protein